MASTGRSLPLRSTRSSTDNCAEPAGNYVVRQPKRQKADGISTEASTEEDIHGLVASTDSRAAASEQQAPQEERVAGEPCLADALLEKVEQQIRSALRLDLERRPRMTRSGEKEITLHKRKQAGETERNRVLQIAYLWGYKSQTLTWKQRQRVAKAACRLVAYDYGFETSLSDTMVYAWDRSLMNSLDSGEDIDMAVTPRHAGSATYVTGIEAAHPVYLDELWRYAVKTKGSGATYQELAETMNEKSAAPGEHRTKLSISPKQLSAWLKTTRGSSDRPKKSRCSRKR